MGQFPQTGLPMDLSEGKNYNRQSEEPHRVYRVGHVFVLCDKVEAHIHDEQAQVVHQHPGSSTASGYFIGHRRLLSVYHFSSYVVNIRIL
jgi:hypothetical protein